jgi:hypothetical protein
MSSRSLDNFGYLPPHLDEARGELRTREDNVLLQDKKQIRMSPWKDSRRAIDVFQFGLEQCHLGSCKLGLRRILDDPELYNFRRRPCKNHRYSLGAKFNSG